MIPVPRRMSALAVLLAVGWSSDLTAGNTAISVEQKKPSCAATAYYVLAEGRPVPPAGDASHPLLRGRHALAR